MNINQEQLLIFKTVMETGSFSAAARKLGKVPSAVSMSISNLEIDLNIQLFKRNGREPIPTQEAKYLYKKTENLLIEINQWKQYALALGTGLESSFNIVIASELIHTQWIKYIQILEQQFPILEINIFSAPQEDAMKMLMQNEVQFALLFEREMLDHREAFVELFSESITPVSSLDHPLCTLQQITLEQLSQHRQIVVTSRDKTIKPELVFSKDYWRTDHYHLALTLIEQKLGWGFLPQAFLESLIQKEAKHLKVLNTIDFTPNLRYFIDLVWNKETSKGLAGQYLINYARQQRNK
ncbi:LysR family transcriptional regulator [Acinetobacter nectaris]|uniref:LysR family transcriptional regulator n=1 Tax=Acinetobacter nectaris TaxID=1219382 RepID=UPI001F15DA9B|nr:LysR family transcriptional regulator [Acinetobacter nectaris]MCF8999110.1 LysR family transcriptional regulator [Acinetobacter nectaris]MCF9026560.1 LysR family transcriptional regulator [Acinetobacter nectaris]